MFFYFTKVKIPKKYLSIFLKVITPNSIPIVESSMNTLNNPTDNKQIPQEIPI